MTFKLVNIRTVPWSKFAKAGGSPDFRNKADRVKIGLAFIDGIVEDRAAGRSEC